MAQTIGIDSSTRRAGSFRRGLLMVLAFVYLFVGIAHNATCFDQAVASSVAIETAADPSIDPSHDGGTKSDIVLCDHCPTCVPAVLPAHLITAVPCGVPAAGDMSVASLVPADHAWLDTPPPKNLT